MLYNNVSSLNFVQEILSNLEEVKLEFSNLKKFQIDSPKCQSRTVEEKDFFEGKINTYMLKIDEDLLDYREKRSFLSDKENKLGKINAFRNMSNFSSYILDKYSFIRQYYFNEVFPKAKINPHHGVNGVNVNKIPTHFRIQITIIPGENCYFYIEGYDPILYKENLSFGFEDGLVKHWLENKGELNRTVLILDVDKELVMSQLKFI